ncbi:protein FAR1-RELATED SEQUENCE 5-like [Chenopodium quinoa]|uniref:protein FAR1-RELATED SEQUENCE 5-like n=1 Tax=Chenopodium quinoa TaxID=63459 RepID=UPI000B78A7DA|nr:protein FAR1-RELATED SEQUENCE 5-like [Chenopodium quinoa]
MDFFVEDDLSDVDETHTHQLSCDSKDDSNGDDSNGDEGDGHGGNGDENDRDEDNNEDDDNNESETENYEMPKAFRGLEVWEEIGKRLEDFTFEDMQRLSFKDLQTCIDFYKMYAKCMGFGIRRKHTRLRKLDGHPTSQIIWCNREGFREAKHLLRPDRKRKEKPITRCGCTAMINFKWDHLKDSWYVKSFVAEHNHALIPMNQVYFERTFRDVSEADQIYMKSLIDGVKPSITMRNIARNAGGLRGVGFLKKDLYNACEKFKKEEIKDGDTETVLAYLLGKTASDPNFFLRYTRHPKNGIEKMFWCDGISQGDYKAFGSVIAFDTTYKVNAYQKPFVVIVGVNHHRKTMPFGVALVTNEKTDTYIWVLKRLKKDGGGVTPLLLSQMGTSLWQAQLKKYFQRLITDYVFGI